MRHAVALLHDTSRCTVVAERRYSPDNFKRLARCNELAKKKGVHPMTIALAYVLAQPFPMWSLIGPASLEEGLPSYAALEVRLTKAEVARLNLE